MSKCIYGYKNNRIMIVIIAIHYFSLMFDQF